MKIHISESDLVTVFPGASGCLLIFASASWPLAHSDKPLTFVCVSGLRLHVINVCDCRTLLKKKKKKAFSDDHLKMYVKYGSWR